MDFTFKNLVEVISKQIRVDTELNVLEIEFVPKAGLAPIVIRIDTGARVYIQLKKKNLNFTNNALYVTIKQIDNSAMPTASTGTRDKRKVEAIEQKILHEIDMSKDGCDFDENDSDFDEGDSLLRKRAILV